MSIGLPTSKLSTQTRHLNPPPARDLFSQRASQTIQMASISTTPFADPLWLNRSFSPYYTASHRRLQKEAREYVETYISPFCEDWEKQGFVPQEVHGSQASRKQCLANKLFADRFTNGTQRWDTLLSVRSHLRQTILTASDCPEMSILKIGMSFMILSSSTS